MNSKFISTLVTLTLSCASIGYSDPKQLGASSSHQARQQDSKADHDLVHGMVQIAREKFEARNFKGADKILQAALEIEPRNNEAWYYSNLVQEALEANKHRKNIRPWYPTNPPRPVHE
jgi:Tfp pilus assembly protein PilF